MPLAANHKQQDMIHSFGMLPTMQSNQRLSFKRPIKIDEDIEFNHYQSMEHQVIRFEPGRDLDSPLKAEEPEILPVQPQPRPQVAGHHSGDLDRKSS